MEVKCDYCGNHKNVSIPLFISDLDYDQLVNCKKLIEEAINKKNEEEKIKLWVVVEDDWCCHKYFVKEDYLKAVELLSKLARGSFDKGDLVSYEISSKKVFKSEVEDYINP